MAKKFSASEMLQRSQARPRPEPEAAPPVADEVTGRAVNESTEVAIDPSTGGLVDSSPGRLASSSRYQKTAVFFAPHQKAWLREVSRELPEGLSTSDVVRLAVERLVDDVGAGLELESALVAQARQEAERYAGRRNSGVNQLMTG